MAYDVGVALRRFKSLIRWTSWRASQNRALKMAFEDLEAEGFLTLVECCRSFPEGQIHFARYFKRAWYNKLKNFYRTTRWQKNQGIEVELDHAAAIPEQDSSNQEFLERMKSRYEEINPLLSDDAKRLLELLLEPTAELSMYAWQDFCRKNKLRSQGKNVTGDKSFRIRTRHIRGVLKMTRRRLREVVVEITLANKKWRKM